MLVGAIAEQPRGPQPQISTKVIAVSSSQAIGLTMHKRFARTITVSSPQGFTQTPAQVATPTIGAGGIKATSRLLQPGNLQIGQRLRVNWQHPLASGLVYLEMFDQLHTAADDFTFMPQFIGKHGALTIGAGSGVRSGPGGIGLHMTANTGGLRVASGNAVAVPATRGTYFAYVTADFAGNDSVRHYVTSIGNESTSGFGVLKFSDNNSYFGWVTASVSYRAIASSIGLWSAGDTFMYGGTWNTSDVLQYVKGKQVAALGSAPTTHNTATGVFRIGNSINLNEGWGSVAGRNFIYYTAMWNRDLSAAECNYLNQNPYCFMTAAPPRP